ncbi:MAG: ABC transporter ATP-binding protein [Aestuariivita sp.]|nr:ABC transporter ATP-binding protein [Aestuariivita sp.]
MNGASVTLKNISKSWDKTPALNDISLEVAAGKFTALLGPSGCGKSTALRLVSGLEEPTSGQILIDDKDVTHTQPSHRDIAMVFQSYALFPHLTVAENIVFGLKVRGLIRKDRDNKLKAAAQLLGLSQLLDRKPSQLSGGQQQRVALGRAIVADKSIFLMDEPLSNLDAKLRAEMREEIRDLQHRLGVTMLYVTHDQVEAITMADQVVLMNEGRVEQVASPRVMYEKPATLFAAKFIGTPPMITFSPRLLSNSLPKPLTHKSQKLTFGIRPEALALSDSGFLKGEVRNVEYLGADAMVECRVGDEFLLCRAPGRIKLKKGSSVNLAFDLGDLHVFDTGSGNRSENIIAEIEMAKSSQNASP